ncbi:MAG: hypothetical protein HFJ25_03350 [Clostridia bacterium]|nr:hypothetical protein [Clostridia bacterium]
MKIELKRKYNKEEIFLIGFVLYLIQSFMRTTMFKEIIPVRIFSVVKYIGLIFVLYKIIDDKYTIKRILVIFMILTAFLVTLIESTYSILLEYFILIIGAKDVEWKKIVNLYFKTICILLILTIISAKLGIIENLVYFRKSNGRYREAFGVIYPTDFAAHVLFLCLSYIALKDRKITVIESLFIIGIALLVYYYCDARLDAICIMLAAFISFVYKWNLINFKNFFVKYGLIFSFFICEILSIYLTINYNSSSKFYTEVNDLLTSRLRIGNMMYEEYGITMFGQLIEDHGFGGNLKFEYDVYNYIDCSYLRILLKYGLAVSFIITIFNIIISKKIYKNQNYIMLLIFFIVSVNSIAAQHYIDFSYNFLLLIYLAKMEDENISIENIGKEKVYV